MTPRRSHSIKIQFHDNKLSSKTWSPFQYKWPKDVQDAVLNLERAMQEAIAQGEVTD